MTELELVDWLVEKPFLHSYQDLYSPVELC